MYQSLNEKETMFIYTIALKISIFVTLIKFLTNFWYLNDFDNLIKSELSPAYYGRYVDDIIIFFTPSIKVST